MDWSNLKLRYDYFTLSGIYRYNYSPVLPESIEIIIEVSVDGVIAGKVLMEDVLSVVLPAGVGVGGHPGPDLLLHDQVHVAAGQGVASTQDTGYHQHQGAQATVDDDLDIIQVKNIFMKKEINQCSQK